MTTVKRVEQQIEKLERFRVKIPHNRDFETDAVCLDGVLTAPPRLA